MPAPHKTLTCNDVRRIAEEAFDGHGTDCVGVEVEWPVFSTSDLSRPAMADLESVAEAPLPAHGRVSIEPGGQIELSTAPFDSTADALRAVDTDEAELRERLRGLNLSMAECPVDTVRSPHRILEKPRYAAMESFYTARGPEGLWMMANTASVQINLSHTRSGGHRRWYLMNRIGPLLIAMFANSPGIGPDGMHWQSLRQAIWSRIDRGRTKPVPVGDSPIHDWAAYALAADVFYIDADPGVAVAPGMSFGRWLTEGHEVGWPTAADLRYHLTTLFPPIRPRGWLELRMIDALPPQIRAAAVHVATAAVRDDVADEVAGLPDVNDLWITAARDGLDHPILAAASRRLVELVTHALLSSPDTVDSGTAVAAFADEYTLRDRCPADDGTPLSVSAFPALVANHHAVS